MEQINIKPLSVNQAWKGKRYRTDKYKNWALFLKSKLKKEDINFNGKISITLEFGFSSKGSDLDNPVKPFLDILSQKFGFNDNQIYQLLLYKKIVKKGDEFIRYSIKKIQ